MQLQVTANVSRQDILYRAEPKNTCYLQSYLSEGSSTVLPSRTTTILVPDMIAISLALFAAHSRAAWNLGNSGSRASDNGL